jgi:hypothetical protein
MTPDGDGTLVPPPCVERQVAFWASRRQDSFDEMCPQP